MVMARINESRKAASRRHDSGDFFSRRSVSQVAARQQRSCTQCEEGTGSPALQPVESLSFTQPRSAHSFSEVPIHADERGADERALRSTVSPSAETSLSRASNGTDGMRLQRKPDTSTPARPPQAGIPNTNCGAYQDNAWWLPQAYVINATCACKATPNQPSANCVRKLLQDRMKATPASLKWLAASQKTLELGAPLASQYFVQTTLTPQIYYDHVYAYAACGCPSGPAPYPAWIGVTSVPIPSCDAVGATIRYFGSCHGIPGYW